MGLNYLTFVSTFYGRNQQLTKLTFIDRDIGLLYLPTFCGVNVESRFLKNSGFRI